MKRYCLLCLMGCCFFLLTAQAQEKEVRISTEGVSSDLSRKDMEKAVRNFTDSVSVTHDKSFLDSLHQINELVDGQRVYSQKQWKKMYDSLLKLPDANLPTLPNDLKSVSEEDLLQALNDKFALPTAEEFQVPDPTQDANTLVAENVDKYQALSDKLKTPLDVNALKLPSETLTELPPLPGNEIKSKYLKSLDSLRAIKLAQEKLKIKETEIACDIKVSDFVEKPTFWDKAYFEGVVGFSPGDFKTFQASPALGYHFSNNYSLGIGPNLVVQKQDKVVSTTVGIKTLAKAEFLKRRVYLQVEDLIGNFETVSSSESKNKFFQQHSVFVGGGFLLDIHAPVTLNFSALYCVTENEMVTHQFSPMVLRIGLSSLKIKN